MHFQALFNMHSSSHTQTRNVNLFQRIANLQLHKFYSIGILEIKL